MSKHTPGPWWASQATFDKKTWSAFNSKDGVTIVKKANPEYGLGGGDVIAVVWSADGEDASERANARLISAAPDLLAALKAVLPYVDLDFRSTSFNLAETAIAKAEGRE